MAESSCGVVSADPAHTMSLQLYVDSLQHKHSALTAPFGFPQLTKTSSTTHQPPAQVR